MTQPTLAQALAVLQLYNVHALRHELEQLQPGQPRAQHFDADRTSSGQGPADPTAAAAHVDGYGWTRAGGKGKRTVDPQHPAATDLASYNRHVDQLYRSALALAALADKHLPTHEPRRITIAADTRGCRWCQQAGIDQHQPAWRTTDCGFLNTPVPLCHSCYDFARDHGTRPTNEQIIRHSKGKGWTVRTTGKRSSLSVANIAATRPGGSAA